MATIELILTSKKLLITHAKGEFNRKLAFEIEFPRRESLASADGERVLEGYIEFGENVGTLDQPTITYTPPWEDDGELNPASISFYAFLPSTDFYHLATLSENAQIFLYINTKPLDGPIQYGVDPDGYEKVWHTEMERRVVVESFELRVFYSGAEAT